MPSRRTIKATVTVLSGENIDVEIIPEHTAQDIIGALIQSGKLPAEDSFGAAMHYLLVDDATMSSLAGDRPLLDQGLKDGAVLRVKPGTVQAGGLA